MKASPRIVSLAWLGMILIGCRGARDQGPAGALEGEWAFVSVEARGFVAQVFEQIPEPHRFKTATFSRDRLTLKNAGSPDRARYRVDPTTEPKSLDLAFTVGGREVTLPGIYTLDGDRLTLAFDNFGESRPTEFLPPKDDPEAIRLVSTATIVLRRLAADPKRDTLERDRAQAAAGLGDIARILQDQVLDERKYPPEAIFGADGTPLLSWRVALLPRFAPELYAQFRLDEPWDGPHNQALIPKMPKLYALPGVKADGPGLTYYRLGTGRGTLYENRAMPTFSEHLRDGQDHLLILEAAEPVPWTKPDELDIDRGPLLPRLGRQSADGFLATSTTLGEDRVRFLPKTLTEEALRSMIRWRRQDDAPSP